MFAISVPWATARRTTPRGSAGPSPPATSSYLPAGTYRLSDTVMLRRNTKLVGEHTLASSIVLRPNTPAFMDGKNPRPILEPLQAALS